VSFAAITLCVASQRVFIVVVDFVIDSIRELLDTPSHIQLGVKRGNVLSTFLLIFALNTPEGM
jgi:hypothetical protein